MSRKTRIGVISVTALGVLGTVVCNHIGPQPDVIRETI